MAPPEKVCIITTDGRNLVGTLAAHDYTTNLVRPSSSSSSNLPLTPTPSPIQPNPTPSHTVPYH
jgi:hypothetical protein